jgi:hypothetical protein
MDWWPFLLKMETLESASVNLADTIARHFHLTARTFGKLSSAALLASQHGVERHTDANPIDKAFVAFLRRADEATLAPLFISVCRRSHHNTFKTPPPFCETSQRLQHQHRGGT